MPNLQNQETLRLYRKIGYSIGHFYNDLISSYFFSYALVYVKLSVGLETSYGGYIYVVVQFADIIGSPIIGIIQDKYRCGQKLGNRMIWYIAGVIIITLGFGITFNVTFGSLANSQMLKVVYYIPPNVALGFGYALIQVTHLAVLPDMTMDETDRVQLNSWRNAATLIGFLSVYCGVWILLTVQTSDSDLTKLTSQDVETFNVNIRVKVISDIEERIGDGSHGNVKSGSCDVIDNITFSVKVLYMHEKHINLMKKGRFYLLRGVLVSNYIKVGDQTVVMSCGPFSFDNNIELNYVSPPIVSVVEALASPKKRRISVCGTVAEVSGVLTSEKSTRKVLKLSDGPNNFVVKLWGGKSSLNVPPVGSDVTVTGVNIGDFQGKAQGNSSLTTCVVESSHEETFEGVLDAMSFDRDDCLMTLVGSEVMLSVSTTMMQQVFKDLDFKPNVAVKGKKKGSRVVEIERVVAADV